MCILWIVDRNASSINYKYFISSQECKIAYQKVPSQQHLVMQCRNDKISGILSVQDVKWHPVTILALDSIHGKAPFSSTGRELHWYSPAANAISRRSTDLCAPESIMADTSFPSITIGRTQPLLIWPVNWRNTKLTQLADNQKYTFCHLQERLGILERYQSVPAPSPLHVNQEVVTPI